MNPLGISLRPLVFWLCLALMVGVVAPAAWADGEIKFQWFGQSAFKITSPGGKVIMIDPFITGNPKTPEALKDLDKLGKIDLILITHAHGDHLGDGPTLAKKQKVPMWGPAGLNQSLTTLGELPAELAPRMNKGGVITPLGPDIKIIQTRAEHSSELLWTNPETKKKETHVGGEPIGWIIQFENGVKVYHMGDTGLFGDMKFIGEFYKPDLVLIPIGGHFVMSPEDAAFATKEYLKPKAVVPMHYGTFPALKGTPEEYKAALGNSSVKVIDVDPGGTFAF